MKHDLTSQSIFAIESILMDDVHLSTARHFRYELRLGGKFSAGIWSAGGVPRITTMSIAKQISQPKIGRGYFEF